jgi:uncharacterized protein (TIRG00374 family)
MDKRKIFKLIVSVCILAYLIYKIDPSRIGAVLAVTSLFVLILVAVNYFLAAIMNSLNLYVLLRGSGEKISYRRFISLYWYSFSIGQFSPGRLGEASIVKLLKDNVKIDTGKTISIYVLDKIITFTILATISVLGIFFFFPHLAIGSYILIIAVIIVLLGAVLLAQKNIRLFIRKKFLRKYEKYFKGFSKTLRFLIRKKPHVILLNAVLTVLRQIIIIILIRQMFLEYSLNVPVLPLFISNVISQLSILIPVSFSGIGVKESLGVLLIGSLGYDLGVIATIYLLITFFGLIANTIFFFYFFYRKK